MWRPSHCRRLAAVQHAGHSAPNLALDGHASGPERTLRAPRQVSRPATALIFGGFPMSDAVKVGFVPFSSAARGTLVVFCDDKLKFGAATRKTLGTAADLVTRV